MKDRLGDVKSILLTKDIPAFLITKKENQKYLTGFNSTNCDVVITKDKNYLLTDFRYIEVAREKSHLFEAVLTKKDYTLNSFLQELAPSKLAVEEEIVSLRFYKELKKALDCEIVSGDGIVEEVRLIKDEEELLSISKAVTLGDQCFEYILKYLKPGLTELEIAFEIEMFLRSNGAERLSFDTICVSGVRTSLPHGEPSEKVIQRGDFVTLDFGCVVDGYCSDMTRTVAMGTASKKQKDIYNIVLEAQKAGCNTIKAGVACNEADKVVRDIIENAGYGEYFGHGTGHGVGIEVHEAPTLNMTSNEKLVENTVVTIEPGIYIPKEFGVRIEDLAFVKSSSIINKVRSEKELIII